MKKKQWNDYLYIWTILYFTLGFFNILFAWLGMIDFLVPIFIALFGGGKAFCNSYCGRGQLFNQLGTCMKCSRNGKAPKFLSSKWFRYGFLIFFLSMFGNMLLQTYLVAAGGRNLTESIKLLWMFRVPLDRRNRHGLDRAVQLWFLQHYAHLHHHRPCGYGAVQAQNLVHLLPHGHHDPDDLQN